MPAASPKVTSMSPRGAETERRILDAALALFAEQGFHGTTIPQVMTAAGVGAGSLYRLFASKEALVNAVFRDAKRRLGAALAGALSPPGAGDVQAGVVARASFDGLWDRLSRFAEAEPVAFRFLELQDHVRYLDGESRQLELTVLAPLLLSCLDHQRRGVFREALGADAMMALVWGAFVGLVKAERLGYVKRSRATELAARDACWRALATDEVRDLASAAPADAGADASASSATRAMARRAGKKTTETREVRR